MKTGTNWTYNGKVVEELPEDCEAFGYQITNLVNHIMYVGKKFFWKPKILPVTKTRKRRKRTRVQSDWRDYYGSSEQVKTLVEGGQDFQRTVLRLCRTKGECSYYEAKLQFEYDVLLSDEYYNEFIGCKIHSKHIKK